MSRIAGWLLAACVSTVACADETVVPPGLSLAQIIENNVTARGGLEAWRKIQTMVWVGHIERAHATAPSLPFVLEMKRPNKTHFEIKAQNQMTERRYDGIQGWKQRPTKNGKPELQPYTEQELSFAQDGQGIDGPLVDYQAKGNAVALDGIDEIEGHKAYRMSVKLPSGISHYVWIDTQTFLDIKYDRESRNAFGQSNTVSVLYRNYRTIEGLQIPFMIETATGTSMSADKMVIDKISLNPPLEDRIFAKPIMQGRHNAVLIDATALQPVSPANGSAPLMTSGFSRLNPRSQTDSADAR